jgi:hypothetical protein
MSQFTEPQLIVIFLIKLLFLLLKKLVSKFEIKRRWGIGGDTQQGKAPPI